MTTRKTLSDRGVIALRPRADRYAYPDPELRGHYVRVQPKGAKSYCVVARNPDGDQIWTTLGATGVLPIAEARKRAREIIQRVRDGLPAFEPKAESFGAIVANWLKRHVEGNGLRSRIEIERLLNAHVLPLWSEREFLSIRRSDVAALLDDVEDGHSARQADAVLTIVRSLMNWYAARADDYRPPIVKGMRRQSPHAMARARVLSDEELRAIWTVAEKSGAFGAVVMFCLLTAQRRAKILGLRWADIEGGVWTIPKAPREKDNAGALGLPAMALAIIERQPRFGDNPFVFAGRGDGPINGISKFKARLDRASGVSGWRLHDLRRSARSLMSRAGVSSEHAERVMGHAITGVEGVYDRHAYSDEKARALGKVAALIDAIVHPRENVVPLKKRRAHGNGAPDTA